MTLMELLLLAMLFGVGYCSMSALAGPERPLRTLAGAFPMGCCLWALGVFLIAALPFPAKDVFGMNLSASLLLMAGIVGVSLLVIATQQRTVWRFLLPAVPALALLLLLYWFFFWANISIITADSLSHLHPQKGFESMKSGRAFNQTLAALAALAGQDRYFFPFHPLFFVSLMVLMGECIYHEIKSAGTNLGPALSFALAGPILLASTHMTSIQMFYVNNHLLVATMICLALSLLLGKKSRDQGSEVPLPLAALAVIAVTPLSLLRLEGQFIGIILLVVMLGRVGVDRLVRVRALLLYLFLTAPVLLFLITLSLDGGKTDAGHFAAMLLVTVFLPVFFYPKKPALIGHLQDHASKYTLLSLALVITVFLYLRLDKMVYRLGWVVHNAFDVSHWGFAHQVLIFAIFVLLAVRAVSGDAAMAANLRRIDSLLLFSIAALLSIVFLTYFHGARLGWSSSQNRMLFHFFPAIILWVAIQAGIGFARPAAAVQIVSTKRPDSGPSRAQS